MKYQIDERICEENGIDMPTLFMLLIIKAGVNPYDILDDLKAKHMIAGKLDVGDFLIKQTVADKCADILLRSEGTEMSQSELEETAQALINAFPSGKKPGTNYYWKGNLKDTVLRLRKFFKLYGNRYSSEEIISATESYVSSFNGNYSYMRLLKYFIWKDVKKIDEDGRMFVEGVSDLASYIENSDQEDVGSNEFVEVL